MSQSPLAADVPPRERVRAIVAHMDRFDPTDSCKLRQSLDKLFEQSTRRVAKACAISLPPDFAPGPVGDRTLTDALASDVDHKPMRLLLPRGVFSRLSQMCRDFKLPFDL